MRELRVDGGAVANDLLMQIQADVLQRPVVRAPTTGDDGARRGVPRRPRRRVLEGPGRDRSRSGARGGRFEPQMPRRSATRWSTAGGAPSSARRAGRRKATRREAIARRRRAQKFDVIVIGGGINGAGIAPRSRPPWLQDAAPRAARFRRRHDITRDAR